MSKPEQVPSAGRRARDTRSSRRRPIPADSADEKLSDEAIRAIEEGRTDHAAGRTLTLAEIKRELGIDTAYRQRIVDSLGWAPVD